MDREREALRLKTLAEQKYTSSNLKSALKYATRAHRLSPSLDGLSETLTAFQILSAAAATSPPDWYKILQIDPFSHLNIIKKQYKKLALTLHPDKNPFAACEEAFKLVAEGFRVLSDKTRRKEYDVRLRMAMQEAATEGGGTDAPPSVDGFWAECLACRVVHWFDRKYLGHNLMCPSCKKSFRALEVNEREEDVVGTRVSARIRAKGGGARSVTTSGELCNEGGGLRSNRGEATGVLEEALEKSKSKRARVGEEGITLAEMQMLAKRAAVMGVSGEALENSKSKKAKIGEEGITLSEMQMLAKKKVREEKMRLRVKENAKDREKAKKGEKSSASKGGKIEDKKQREASNGELEIMEVEDSDFYDFDKDRVEKSFKKGQVWAVYDDDDGMPRHYSLIDEVSVYPFKIKLSWLELQIGADERLLSWEKAGVRISCGRFKVAKTDVVDSVNIFSHFVNAERAAREVYRVYPRKGSVWALFNEDASQNKYKRCYDMVVCLTNYDEVYGLSMAYLEKVEGFKSVFKRREIGYHAVKSLEKDDFRLFSHQIPARKLTGEEAPDLSRDCWELDPASLPPELLKIRCYK